MPSRTILLRALFYTIVLLPIFTWADASHAQATRTWVSGVGDDANPCSRTAPCKTFAGAISKTAASGEINVIDPGGFGAVTITKAISIVSDSVEAGVLVSGTNGIVITAGANDNVTLRGLAFEGLGTGLNGVSYTSGGSVYVENCTIHGFSIGIDVAASGASPLSLIVSHSTINNNGTGVKAEGTGVSYVVLDSSTLSENTQTTLSTSAASGSQFILNNDTILGTLNLTGSAVQSFGNNRIVGPAIATMQLRFQ